MTYQIDFLCPHGAAKSVLVAAYCRQLADALGISLCVLSAGTESESEIAPPVVELLRAEGIDVAGQQPRRVTREDLATADRIISLGCDMSDLASAGSAADHWDDIPPLSQDLYAARDKIRTHVEQLVTQHSRNVDQNTPACRQCARWPILCYHTALRKQPVPWLG